MSSPRSPNPFQQSPHPHPLPTRGRGVAPACRQSATPAASHLPPPAWGRDGVGGYPAEPEVRP
jgi:hypothetical protein